MRAVLSRPWAYDALQWLVGGHVGRADFVRTVVRAETGSRILDLGCGTAEILAFLPAGIDYVGWDISAPYIASARARFGTRGRFACGVLREGDVAAQPPFDIVIASGVLHHLDDEAAREFIRLARLAVRNGGRLATIDPVLSPGQHPVARWLIRQDRGHYVRDSRGYADLLLGIFGNVRGILRHRRWLPYTHFMMEASVPDSVASPIPVLPKPLPL